MPLLLLALTLGLAGDAHAQDAAPITVMSFNVRYGTAEDGENHWEKRRAFLLDVVRDANPDLLGLQEALIFQVREIAAALPDHEWVGVGRDDGKEAGEMMAIFYRRARFERRGWGTFWLSPTPDVPGSTGWGNRITRSATWARLTDRRAPGAAPGLLFVNTHFDHQSQPAREQGAALIASWIDGHRESDRVILTGDFNAPPENPAVTALTGRLVDTFARLHPDATETGTFNGFKPGSTSGPRIDYVLADPAFAIRSAEIVRTSRDGRYPSDHFPVAATLVVAEDK